MSSREGSILNGIENPAAACPPPPTSSSTTTINGRHSEKVWRTLGLEWYKGRWSGLDECLWAVVGMPVWFIRSLGRSVGWSSYAPHRWVVRHCGGEGCTTTECSNPHSQSMLSFGDGAAIWIADGGSAYKWVFILVSGWWRWEWMIGRRRSSRRLVGYVDLQFSLCQTFRHYPHRFAGDGDAAAGGGGGDWDGVCMCVSPSKPPYHLPP